MDRYKDRNYKKILKGVKIVYIATAAGFLASGCAYAVERGNLKDKWQSGAISHESYVEQTKSLGQKEENVFKGLTFIGLGAIATEVVTTITKERER